MLKVSFEIVPFGDEDHPRRRTIGHLNIGLQKNVNNVGQYISTMITDGHHEPPNKVVQVFDHPRQDGAFELVRRILEAHMDPDDPGAIPEDALMTALASQNETLDAIHGAALDNNELVSQIETDQLAEAFVIPREPEHETIADEETFIYCESCKNTDPGCVTGVEFAYDSPLHYDGVSEWHCKKCGSRTGRWSRLVLREGESERPHGRGMRTQ